jgi:hypothetical protein
VSAPVGLVAIGRDNYRDFLRLKVKPGQERFVATNARRRARHAQGPLSR